MKKTNMASFLLSIVCVLLFFILSFSRPMDFFIMGIHPLQLVLFLTLLALILGVFGFRDVQGWKEMARSIITVFLSLALSVILVFVLFIGGLLS